MPPQRRSYKQHPPAAKPRRNVFDPWNSSSSGHQTSDSANPGSSYQKAREHRLNVQLQNRTSLLNGPELALVQDDKLSSPKQKQSDNAESQTQPQSSESLTQRNRVERTVNNRSSRDIARLDSTTNPMPSDTSVRCRMEDKIGLEVSTMSELTDTPSYSLNPQPDGKLGQVKEPLSKSKCIFRGCKFYINASTAPFISDHKLKLLIARHGGSISIALQRREVTHVVINERKGSKSLCHQLSSRKVQNEIQKAHIGGIKYITVDWILRSIKAGKRMQTRGPIPFIDSKAEAEGPVHKKSAKNI